MDNNTGDGEKYCSVVVITIMFLCFDVKGASNSIIGKIHIFLVFYSL